MTDQMDGRVPLQPQISIAVDATGDPFLKIEISTPEGTLISADMADQLALQIVGAAAAARVRAGIVRDQMLAGMPADDAIVFVNGLMGGQ